MPVPAGHFLGRLAEAAIALGLLAVGAALRLSGVHFDVVMAFAALPTASSAYILTQRMGGDGPRVAWLISASTLLGMATLPLWFTLLAFLAG